jgi:hypothetical protein
MNTPRQFAATLATLAVLTAPIAAPRALAEQPGKPQPSPACDRDLRQLEGELSAEIREILIRALQVTGADTQLSEIVQRYSALDLFILLGTCDRRLPAATNPPQDHAFLNCVGSSLNVKDRSGVARNGLTAEGDECQSSLNNLRGVEALLELYSQRAQAELLAKQAKAASQPGGEGISARK